jgi:signal transduction histidine kinase
MDLTLRRLVVAWRLLALLWMTGLIVEAFLNDPDVDEPLLAATWALAAVWTGLTVIVARNRTWFVSWWWLVADGAVAVWVALAPLITGSEGLFFGGYPLSWVIYVAYARNQHWFIAGTLSSAVMAATQVADSLIREDDYALIGDIAVFCATAWVVGWGMSELLRNERMRLKAEARFEEERRRRAQSDERAEIAAYLHDSVLQTLTVIQQRDDATPDIRHLTRRQERELRQWIERLDSDYKVSFSQALRVMAWDIEDLYDLRVEVVTVGDCELTDDLRLLLGAAREALANAAKYSGAGRISLYSEVGDAAVDVFVRDRGRGFDVDLASDGRRGISESIIGRMPRGGGTATVRSTPGEGTEVELSMMGETS